MLILGTLIVTWIAHNWWKILLLLVAIIVIHEYMVHRIHKNDPPAEEDGADGADTPAEENIADAAEASDDDTAEPEIS